MIKFYPWGAVSLALVVCIGGGAIYFFAQEKSTQNKATIEITDFYSCIEAGNPAMESYPAQCRTVDGRLFVQEVGNELEKANIIRVGSPRPGKIISSPLEIQGEARGYWYFEGNFPIRLLDEQGKEIATAIGKAQTDWTTEELVLFFATLEFEKPKGEKGTLIFQKDNPSGLPENDDELTMPIRF